MNKISVIKNKYLLLLLLSICILLLPSCLKEGSSFPQSDDEATSIVELGSAQTPDSYTTTYQAFSIATVFENDTAGFYVIVQYNGPTNTAPEDITVTLGTDTAALSAYNDENSTEYVAFDDAMLSYPTTVTIAKGTDRTRFRVIVNDTTGYDFSAVYALPLKIESTTYGTISSNTSTKIYDFVAKNKWDGVYEVTGTLTDVYSSALSNINNYLSQQGYSTMEYELRTISSTKCVAYDNYFFGGYYMPISSWTGTAYAYSYYGSFSIIFEFDPDTDEVVGVTNYYGQPATNTRYAEIDPSGTNKYDESSKTINVKYYMYQSSVVSGTPRVYFDETWTYIGDR
ncbi:MAG: DUF1735 domain-containing protein [Chitinophagaceae bacterium]